MMARTAVLLLLMAGCGQGWAETAVTVRLKKEFKDAHPYTPPAAVAENPDPGDGPALVLEPMLITGSHSFAVDILAEARRATAVAAAAKFSLQQGGKLLSFPRGDLGFWPAIVPVDATPVKKGAVAISVDLLRFKW